MSGGWGVGKHITSLCALVTHMRNAAGRPGQEVPTLPMVHPAPKGISHRPGAVLCFGVVAFAPKRCAKQTPQFRAMLDHPSCAVCPWQLGVVW
jgi:hypothetical protein